MKRVIAALSVFLALPLAAQTINPSQIRPSTTNGQVVTTVGGATVWQTPAAGPSGTQYKIGAYNGAASGGNYLLGQSNATTDATGNNLSVPGALTGLSTNNGYNAYIAQTTPTSNDGIANAEAAAGANGNVFAPSNYAATETGGYPAANNTTLTDLRAGFTRWMHNNSYKGAYQQNCLTDNRLTDTGATQGYQCNTQTSIFLGPGTGVDASHNFFHSANNLQLTSYVNGITQGVGGVINCYKISDCNNYWYLTFAPGNVDGGGEGVQAFATHVSQASNQYESTSTQTGTGLSSIITTPTSAGSAFSAGGNGQFSGGVLMDTSTVLDSGNITAEVVSTGIITTSTTHTASTVWGTSTTVIPDPGNVINGAIESVTVTNNTGTFPTSGSFNACVAGSNNWQEVTLTAAAPSGGSQVLTGVFNYPQPTGIQIAEVTSGLECSAITMNANLVAGKSDPSFVIFYAPSTTTYYVGYYAANNSHYKGIASGNAMAFVPTVYTLANITRTSNVVTALFTLALWDGQRQAMNQMPGVVISGCADSSFNGTVTPTTTQEVYASNVGSPSISYANTGANATTTGCTAQLPASFSAYTIYPMAAVKGLLDPSVVGTSAYLKNPLAAIDGYFDLYPNHMSVTTGDVIEEPFLPNVSVSAFTAYVTVNSPNSQVSQNNTISTTFQGTGIDNAFVGQYMQDANNPNVYFGYGGKQQLPYANVFRGVFGYYRYMNSAPNLGVDYVGCPYAPGDSPYGGGTNCTSMQPYWQFQNLGNGTTLNGIQFVPGTSSYYWTSPLVGFSSHISAPYGAFTSGLNIGGSSSSSLAAPISFYKQLTQVLNNTLGLESPTSTPANHNLAVGTVDGLDGNVQFDAEGGLDYGFGSVSSFLLANNVSVGVHPPVITTAFQHGATYSGTVGSDYFAYVLTALLPNGQETPISAQYDQAFVGNASPIGSGFTSITVTNCPSAAQFGYPSGTTLNLYRTEGATGVYYLIGTCTGTIVDTGGGTIKSIPKVNVTAPIMAGNYLVDPIGSYCFLASNHAATCDTYISRGAANTVNIGSTAGASNGTINVGAITVNGAPLNVTNITVNITGGSAIPAGCGSANTAAMLGLITTSTLYFSPSADQSGVNGWADQTLYLMVWPTANTFNYKICNRTGSSITPSAGVSFNIGAQR